MGDWWSGAAGEVPGRAGRQRCGGRAGEAGQQSEQAGGISQITRETSGSSAFDLTWAGGGGSLWMRTGGLFLVYSQMWDFFPEVFFFSLSLNQFVPK